MSCRDILFVTVDSLRADRVGWHGYERETTPNLDRLADESATFQHAFSHACNTPYSFPSIMASVYASMYGGGKRLAPEATPVAEVLRAEGYATAGFHSNPYLGEEFGYRRGFATYLDSVEEKSVLARARQWVKDNVDGPLFRAAKAVFDASERHVGFEPGSPFVPADELTDRALSMVRAADDGPRFLWVHYMDVHHPYEPPDEHQRPFRDRPASQRTAVRLRRKMLERPEGITEEELRTINDLYDAEIRFTDAEVGRLVEAVRSAWDEPVVCFTADHGDELGDHRGFSHHYPKFFDEYVHVPLLVHDGSGRGRFDELVGLLDVAPTLVDYGGGSIPESYRGGSLRPLVDGDGWDREHVISEWGEPDGLNVCVRGQAWKYIRRESTPDYDWDWEDEELYDLGADPGETENVVGEHPAVRDRFDAVVEEHLETVRGTGGKTSEVEVDAAVRDRLEQLGYRE